MQTASSQTVDSGSGCPKDDVSICHISICSRDDCGAWLHYTTAADEKSGRPDARDDMQADLEPTAA